MVRPDRLLVTFVYDQYAPGVDVAAVDLVVTDAGEDREWVLPLEEWAALPPPQPDKSAAVTSAAQTIARTRLRKSRRILGKDQ
jgi:hypothetical protein